MKRWVSNLPAPPVRKWQSRGEILKSYLDSLSPMELLEVRSSYYALRFGYETLKRDSERKYDPNQPRVPAGKPDGGQWTSVGAALTPPLSQPSSRMPAPYLLAASGRQSAAYCWNQMQIDMLYCSTLPALVNAACRAQAMERYSACLAGKRLPPLPF